MPPRPSSRPILCSTILLFTVEITLDFRWIPHPVIVTLRDNKDYMKVLLYFLLYHYYRAGGPPKIDRSKAPNSASGL